MVGDTRRLRRGLHTTVYVGVTIFASCRRVDRLEASRFFSHHGHNVDSSASQLLSNIGTHAG